MKIPIIPIFFRSFFLQSVWNYERMQNVGFVFSLIPWLRRLYSNDKKKLYERIKAHYGFFNTHPYFASLLIGIVMRLEEAYSRNEVDSDQVMRTKTMLAGPIAAIGDRLIWSTWRAFCGIFAVCYYILHGQFFYTSANIIAGILLYLIVYNFFGHLPIRLLGIFFGYNYSKEVVVKISKFQLQKVLEVIRMIGITILLFSSFIYSISISDNFMLAALFWTNILLAIVLSRKIAEVVVFALLVILNISLLGLLQ
ncbi:MAG: PTS system mannose/fructose/sorbose family transporter subunit IID [Endomicrobia bacterium]|nr:PTS system mannose/fructose/sorbose family transporter subunit IID [Endomicrobiia bacterium]MCX7940339.1 PTS system mannose/fructose/sorbose family transporter subunit IID [Endomicrobiia bacterium]MDW8055230.1 PTS system mannose/fructose/sorbose family transporter subunit IID [Elusimicrobiota bacterium]